MTFKLKPIFPIFFTVFLDLFGIGIVIPVLALIILDPSIPLLASTVSADTRTILLGFLIASFPLAQFFGAPMLGALSDRFGRRPLLLGSIAGTFIGYLLFGLGIVLGNIPLLFISRIIAGFTGGNISIAQSAIADISEIKDKAKNFGLIGMAVGLGFILGPFVGGIVSSSEIASWFSYDTPFWMAAILSLMNLILVYLYLPETLKEKTKTKIGIFTGFINLSKAFTLPNLRVLFLVIFLLTFGFNFFTSFLQVYLFDKYKMSQTQIGYFFGYMGLWIALAQGVISRPISSRYKPASIVQYSILGLAFSLPLLLIPNNSVWLYAVFPLIAVFQGLNMPNSTALVSNMAEADSQGEILGINSSIQAFAMAIPPIISGFIASINSGLPILIAGILTFFAWVVFVFFFKKKSTKKFDAV